MDNKSLAKHVHDKLEQSTAPSSQIGSLMQLRDALAGYPIIRLASEFWAQALE